MKKFTTIPEISNFPRGNFFGMPCTADHHSLTGLRAELNSTLHTKSHFRDYLSSQSPDWCKMFKTNEEKIIMTSVILGEHM